MNKLQTFSRYTSRLKAMTLATMAAVILAITPLATVTTAALADCSAGKSQNIIAHPDDDLFFINPKIMQDIDAGKCVETIAMTSGDAGREPGYWPSRENGLKAAYAQMAGVSNSWTQTNLSILDKSAQLFTLTAQPEVTLLFLRMPNGGEWTDYPGGPVTEGYYSNGYKTLKKLWQNTINSFTTVDGASTYTRQEVIDVLATRMATYGASIIRTLDYTESYGGDHVDHQSVAYFARAAHQQGILQAHTFIGYKGYLAASETANVTGSELTDKQNAYFAYDPYDYAGVPANGGTCSSVSACDAGRLNALERNYAASSESGGAAPWSWETMEGESTAVSGYSADVGNQPTSLTFGGNPHLFYYDATTGDLRHAVKSSGSWSFNTLDGSGGSNGRLSADVGRSPTAVAYNGWINVFYYDATSGNLRHAMSSDGTIWYFQTLDGANGTLGGLNSDLGLTPKALLFGNSLQLFYYDNGNGNLRHAYLNGNNWAFENLEGDLGSISNYDANVGLNLSAVVYQDTLQLFYYDVSNGNLRHTYADANGWHFENLDGNNGSILGFNVDTGQYPHAVLEDTTLHVFYYDATNGDLRHAWTSPTHGWYAENLMGDPDAVIRTNSNIGPMTEAIMYNNQLHVFTYEAGSSQKLIHLWKDGSTWKEEHLDGFGETTGGALGGATMGWEPTPMVFDSKLHVFYYDAGRGNLRHAAKQ